MLKSITGMTRKAAISLGIKKDDETDAICKKRMTDIKHAHDVLKTQLTQYYKSVADHGAHVASLHTALSALYPHDQVMGPKVETLLTKSEQLSGKAVVDALKADMDACLANVAAKHAALSKEVDDRSSLRQDIADLTGKIAAMEAKPNPKEAAKLEETKTKLADSTAAFEAADAKLTPLMESLDKDLAELLNGPYKAFMSGVAAWHAAAAEGYNASLAAETAPVPVTPAAEGGAGAAAAPAS